MSGLVELAWHMMFSSRTIVEHLLPKMQGAGTVSARLMFGEYAIYCDSKLLALICDDQLYVKPTAEGEAFMRSHEEAPPYPGAKDYLLIPEDCWDDADWLSQLIRITSAALPMPRPKPTKKQAASR
jgi:DNA transformation protein